MQQCDIHILCVLMNIKMSSLDAASNKLGYRIIHSILQKSETCVKEVY